MPAGCRQTPDFFGTQRFCIEYYYYVCDRKIIFHFLFNLDI